MCHDSEFVVCDEASFWDTSAAESFFRETGLLLFAVSVTSISVQQSGFTVLKNENWYVTTDSDKKILFTGLDDSMLGNVYMPDSTKIYDSNYNILLIHEPDTSDSFQEYPYDLVLSGHSHGGQVNIPFIPAINQKAISSTNLAKNYVSGMYELNSKTKIYVNTGIGTTHVSGRLGVVPEISIFHIYL